MISDDRHRAIGKVVYISADRFVVELNQTIDNFTVVGFDDMHYVARLGSYVMIPVKSEYIVSEVVGIRDKDPITHSRIHEGEPNKIFSIKYLDLVPVGMLPKENSGKFLFGVSTYPSLYTDALYILHSELDRVFEVVDWEVKLFPEQKDSPTRYKALTIGTSTIFEEYDVKVRIDEFFGGHVAVLGNTGSGKSCTVATIAQSLFEKIGENYARGATLIFLDVNGEYRRAFTNFSDPIGIFYFKMSDNPTRSDPSSYHCNEQTKTFRLPHWFMSVEEWELLLRASERTQKPVLRTALGFTTLFNEQEADRLERTYNHILASCIIYILNSDSSSPSKKDQIEALLSTFSKTTIDINEIRNTIAIDYGEMKALEQLTQTLTNYLDEEFTVPEYSNCKFEFEKLEQSLELALYYEEAHGNRQIRDHCAPLLTRFKWVKNRAEFAFLRVSPNQLERFELQQSTFLENFLGLIRQNDKYTKKSQIIILDMNESMDEVVEVVAAVMGRLIFECLRKAIPRNRMPVHIILEEAHRYIAEKPSRFAIGANRIFERISKEGRKYGAFLVAASQRPSELSSIVLSQCSNFIIHRIQNPVDLSYIRQITPFISESVLNRLPSLPKQHALIFGNAVNIPTTFKVRTVYPEPLSNDAPISKVWFKSGEEHEEINLPLYS